jgi:hypothetical protein
MKLSKKIRRGVTALAIAPLVGFEAKEQKRRIKERLNRSRQKQKKLSLENT